MAFRRRFPTTTGMAHVVFTDREDGDFRPPARRQRGPDPIASLVEYPRSWLRQVHGAAVIEVLAAGTVAGAEGDALVTRCPGAVLSVLGADCPLVALISPDGVLGVAHAGWRGLLAGVLPATVAAMAQLGVADITALLGPCISPAHYEFSDQDLQRLTTALGPTVAARTADGRPALDLAAAVAASLQPLGVTVDRTGWRCTAANTSLFSHRARADTGRHAALVWLEPPASGGASGVAAETPDR